MASKFDITEVQPIAEPSRFAVTEVEPIAPSRFAIDEDAAINENRQRILDKILFEDISNDIVAQSETAKELIRTFDEPEADTTTRIDNRLMLSNLFGLPLNDVILLEQSLIKQLFDEPLEELSDAVVNKNLKEDIIGAIKEVPENLWIGTIGLTASVLENIKRRAIQLAGGGALDDEALKHQFEAITPDLKPRQGSMINPLDPETFIWRRDRFDFLRPQRPLPGAILGEAVGIVTRLPDIAAKILRKKQRKLQEAQDIAALSNAPITKLSRLVQQSGVPSMGVAVGMSLLTGNPLVGLVILGETEGGAAFERQLEEGGSVRKALIIGELSGAAEIGGEMLVLPKLVRGLKEGISIRKGLTLIAENALQEGVTGFNQTFLDVFGTETTQGTDTILAAKKAFVAGYKAIPENAFVGGATAGLVDIVATPVNIARGRRANKAEARRLLNNIINQVETDITEAEAVKEPPEAPIKAPAAEKVGVKPEIGIKLPIEERKAILAGLTYKEVQQQAKELGIKANQKKEALIEQIIEAEPLAPEAKPAKEAVTVKQLDANQIIEKIDKNTITNEQATAFIKSRLNEAEQGKVEGIDIFAVGALKTAEALDPIVRRIANAASNQMARVQAGQKPLTPEKLATVSGIDIDEIRGLIAPTQETLAKPAVAPELEAQRQEAIKIARKNAREFLAPTELKEALIAEEIIIDKIDQAKKEGRRLISQAAFEAAKKRLIDPTALRVGIDPQSFIDLATIGAFHIESGIRNFADWSVQMVKDFGEKVRPHLQAVWNNIHKPAAEAELAPRPGETKDEYRARVRAARGIKLKPAKKKPVELPLGKPTKAEQMVIDAKKFNKQLKEHQAAVEGEAGLIDTEDTDKVDEPLGRTMTPEWYEENSEAYKKTILEKASETAKRTFKGIDKVIGATSTRLNNISPELFRRTRRHEFNVKTRTTEQIKRIEPFIKLTKKLNKKALRQLDLAFKNSDGNKIRRVAAENNMTAEFRAVQRVLDELFNAGNAVGLEIDYRKNYMPRVVKDSKGFLEFFQKGDDWSIIRTVIENKESQRGRALTETERAAAVNTLLRGYRTTALTLTAPGAAKARVVEEIDAFLNQFYHDFRTSLVNYIHTMNEKIAAREFFGRQSKEITKLRAQQSTLRTRLAKLATRQGRQKAVDVEKEIRIGFLTATLSDHISKAKEKFEEVTERLDRMGADDLSNTVGNYVIGLVTNNEIKPSQEKEVRDLLMGMFDPQGTHGLVGDAIALTYIDVLGSTLNAITQLEELGLTFYRAPLGVVPETIKAVLNLSEITTQDIGITSIGEEFSDADFKKALSAILGVTGFEKIDRVGKQTFINAVIKKMRQQAKRPDKTFMDRLQRVFGNETAQVIEDLKSGEITDNVKYLAFNQLLDIQPVATSEMPEAYNRAGNLRILYTLKTFMIKQLDFVRTEAFQDMKSPNTFMRGFGRLIWLAFSISLFGAGADALKDFLRGRPFSVRDSVVDTFLRRIFFSKFQFSKALRDGIGTAFLEGFVPPTKSIDALTKDIKNVWKKPEKAGEIFRSVPIVGELYYWWFGSGREKALKEQKKARRDAVRRKPLFTGVKE